METAHGYYELKKRFHLSDTEIALQFIEIKKKPTSIYMYISLVTLPKEVQELVNNEELTLTKAYEISRLGFDLSFPSTGRQKLKEWLEADPTRIWDFTWDQEPERWKNKKLKFKYRKEQTYQICLKLRI